jgi:glucoamylase
VPAHELQVYLPKVTGHQGGTPMSGRNLHRLFALTFTFIVFAAPAIGQDAPGGPGAMPTWTPANKEAVGTSTTVDSRVWFTLEGGTLTEVYYPQLDSPDVRRLEFAVSDGKRVWIESRDLEQSVTRIRPDALLYRQTNRDRGGRFTISKIYATDPARDTLLIDVTFAVSASSSYSLYVLYSPSLRNSGYGDTGFSANGILVAAKQGMSTALISTIGFAQTSNGFQGTSDGYTDLLLHHRLLWSYSRAENGDLIQAARIPDVAHLARFLRLVVCAEEKRIVEQPSIVASHFLTTGRVR